jgi:Skp family chaperone for outer membrane proteins
MMRVLCLLFCCLSFAGAEVKGSGPIGVLNLEEVVNNAKIFSVKLDGLKQQKAETDATLNAFEAEEKRLVGALEVLDKGKEMYAKNQEELEVLRVRRKMFRDRMRNTLERRYAAILREGYSAMRAQLKPFAEDQQLKLVVVAPLTELSANPEILQMQINSQSALYYDDTLDITKKFIVFLNGRYVADEGAKKDAASEADPAKDGGAPAPVEP